MTRDPFYDVAEDVLAESAEQLFAACRRPMAKMPTWTGATDPPIDLAVSIGFTAQHLRGALVLGLPARTAAALSPLTGTQRDALVDDWACELANQLLGRVKNKLLAWDLQIRLGMAMAVRSDNLRVHLTDRQVVGACLTDGYLKAYCWIDALVGPGLEMKLVGSDAQAEGKLVLF